MIDGDKVCNVCNELKPFDDFYKGFNYCKKCHYFKHNEYKKQWRKNKREKDKVIREGNKLIKKQEKEKESELLKIRKIEERRLEKIRIKEEYLKSDEYINGHKVCNVCNELKPFDDFYKRVNGSIRTDCKKCCNLRQTEQRKIRRETDDEYRKKTNILSRERKKRRMKTDDEYRKKQNKKNTNRKGRQMKTDPLYRFRKLLSNNIRNSFYRDGFTKVSRTYKILGAEWSVIKEYFESKFTEGMSWENYGKWQIDHILPISTATCEEDVIRLNHYTNLQPLWEEDNLRKSNNILPEFEYLIN